VEVPAPSPALLVAKVDDRGTRRTQDDRPLAGAHIAIRPDDGDGDYEPESDDSEIVFEGVTSRDPLEVPDPPAGDFWVVEVRPPQGYNRAEPQLIRRAIDPTRNCTQRGGDRRCTPDDDQRGGSLVIVVANTRAGLPPTDTIPKRFVDRR
jgi:hypothetical protein